VSQDGFFEILKMLTETLPRIPFSVIDRCSQVPTSHWLQGKYARISLLQAVSFKHFQWQIGRFRIFEAGYWKDFQSNFKGAGKNIIIYKFVIFRTKNFVPPSSFVAVD
jgi:hypothetical protein